MIKKAKKVLKGLPKGAQWGILAGAVIFGIALGVSVGLGLYKESSPNDPKQARNAPQFKLLDGTGHAVSLKAFAKERGGPMVLVHFWASWCGPCLEELPKLLDLAQWAEGRKLAIVAVTVDDKWADARKILASQKQDALARITWLIDPEMAVARDFGTYEYPETYLLSPQLEIMTKWVGPQDWESAKLRQNLGVLLPK